MVSKARQTCQHRCQCKVIRGEKHPRSHGYEYRIVDQSKEIVETNASHDSHAKIDSYNDAPAGFIGVCSCVDIEQSVRGYR